MCVASFSRFVVGCWARLSLVLVLWGSLDAWCARGQAQDAPVRLPVVVHMAQEAGADVAPASFVTEQLARANEVFAAYGVAFELQGLLRSGTASRMESREDRDALGRHVRPRAVHCFVVGSLRDVDEPERMRQGVHWHARKRSETPGAHYVILSAIAGPYVLAHELGHFLGNPAHSQTPGNLMSYERSEVLPFLDAAQQRRLGQALRAYLKSGELEASSRSTAARATSP